MVYVIFANCTLLILWFPLWMDIIVTQTAKTSSDDAQCVTIG